MVVRGASGWGPWKLGLDLLGDVSGLKILDLAAGGGYFSNELARRGGLPTGCDILDDWKFPDVPFVRADMDAALPFEDNGFDMVCVLEGLNYVESVPRLLRETHRILKPGGRMLLTVPNCLCIESRLKFLLFGSFRWFPHPSYLSGEKLDYTDIGRDPIRVTTLVFECRMANFCQEEIRFGSSRVSAFGQIGALQILALTKLLNAVRKKSKRVPPIASSFHSLIYRNVGVLVSKACS